VDGNQLGNRDFSFISGLYTAFLCVIFGSNAVAVKLTFVGVGIFTTAAIRFSIAALAIFVWAKVTGKTIRLKDGQIHQLVIFSLLFTTQLSLFYFGLSKSNVSRGTLITNLLPFFILFLAHFFIPGDRITKRKFWGLMMGFLGVGFVFLEKQSGSDAFRLGDLMMLLGTGVWACNSIYLKRIINAFDPFQIVLYSMIFSVPLFFLLAVLWDRPMIIGLDTTVVTALLFQSLVTASFGFVAWNTLLQKYGAVALHSFVFISPIAGVALGGLVLGEPITPNIILSLVVIVSGILLVHLKPRKEVKVYPIRRSL